MKERELPEGWEWIPLSNNELFSFDSGTWTGKKQPLKKCPIIRNTNFSSDGAIDTSSIAYIDVEERLIEKKKLHFGDIIIEKSGGGDNQPVGRVVLFNLNTPDAYLFSNFTSRLRILDTTKVLPEYIHRFLHSFHKSGMTLSMQRKTTGIRNLILSDYKKIQIPVPSLSTQRKIVAVLERAERLQRLRAEADALTEQLVQSVFLEMFGDPVTNQKEWDTKVLGEIGKIVTGNTPSRGCSEYYGNYIEWIKSDNINTPYTYLTKSKEMLSIEGSKVGRIAPAGSVLITCIAGSISCIGNAAVANRDVAFNQQINAIIPNEKVNSLFLYHVILNSKRYLQNFSTQSMKGMISKSLLSSIPIIVPPIDIQCHFAKVALAIENIYSKQQNSHCYINSLSDALMSKAFTGELVSN